MRININIERCTACRTCEIVCSWHKLHKVNPRKARIRIVHGGFDDYDRPVMCRQCAKPGCVEVCHVGALEKDATLGIIKVDEEVCLGCGSCAERCAVKAIRINPESNTPLICDLCQGKPTCVAWCRNQALSLETPSTEETDDQK